MCENIDNSDQNSPHGGLGARAFFSIEFSDPRFEYDGLRHITVKSENLKGRGDITVFIPKGIDPVQNLPLCILLHGVYGSHWAWTLKAGVHQITQNLINQRTIKPMILAMPSDGLWGDGSGYLEHQNQNFENWIVQDVPAAVRQLTSFYTHKSKTFITGLSMGGYGSMRLGAEYPSIFQGFSGLSSVTTFESLLQFLENKEANLLSAMVTKPETVGDCLVKNKSTLQPFRFDCGTSDLLIHENRLLHQQLIAAKIPHQYQENEGAHDWAYWEKHIVDNLIFFDSLH